MWGPRGVIEEANSMKNQDMEYERAPTSGVSGTSEWGVGETEGFTRYVSFWNDRFYVFRMIDPLRASYLRRLSARVVSFDQCPFAKLSQLVQAHIRI